MEKKNDLLEMESLITDIKSLIKKLEKLEEKVNCIFQKIELNKETNKKMRK